MLSTLSLQRTHKLASCREPTVHSILSKPEPFLSSMKLHHNPNNVPNNATCILLQVHDHGRPSTVVSVLPGQQAALHLGDRAMPQRIPCDNRDYWHMFPMFLEGEAEGELRSGRHCSVSLLRCDNLPGPRVCKTLTSCQLAERAPDTQAQAPYEGEKGSPGPVRKDGQ